MENVAVDSKVDSLNFRCRRQAVALHNPPPYVMQMPTNLYKFYLVRIIEPINKQKLVSWPRQGGKQEARGLSNSQKPALVSAQGKNSMLPYLHIFTF
ncbi:hypothetical protein D5086_009217 [Populus alba]|uniref:Uncharacterized protein n=1 Tax=Populus alba TaxID=43335 RepID=A0ACC4CIA9_POPAL